MAKALVVGRSGHASEPHEVWTVVDGERTKGATATHEEMVQVVDLYMQQFDSYGIILDGPAALVLDSFHREGMLE